MIRNLPIIPTIIVVAAAAIMVWLGFWQFGKIETQQARLDQYALAEANPVPVAFPNTPAEVDAAAYRRSSVNCTQIVGEPRIVAGRNANDVTGYVFVVSCRSPNNRIVDVQLGWMRGIQPVDWDAGVVTGIIEPLRTGGAKLVADPPVAGLNASAPPKKKVIDHLAYAGQWFFFALIALVIYWIAVRARIAKRD